MSASLPGFLDPPPPDPAIPVRFSGDLRRRLGAMARRTGRPAAELIAAGVAEYLTALEARLDPAPPAPAPSAAPLDRFFDRMSPEEEFERTHSGTDFPDGVLPKSPDPD